MTAGQGVVPAGLTSQEAAWRPAVDGPDELSAGSTPWARRVLPVGR